MQTLPRTSTTEMEVTSIRLERDLKERLKELSGSQGYQALIRDILWNFVGQKSGTSSLSALDIRATIAATAEREESCALTGRSIQPQEAMLLGWTSTGTWVPLSLDGFRS